MTAMVGRIPASPSLSPGRRAIHAVPPSPASACRLSTAGSLSAAVGTSPNNVTLARQSKSTSDLNQTAHVGRYDPSRIVGGATHRGASPPAASNSPRESIVPRVASGSSGTRTTSPTTTGSAPPRQKVPAAIWPVLRGASTERRPTPQWTASVSVPSWKAPVAEVFPVCSSRAPRQSAQPRVASSRGNAYELRPAPGLEPQLLAAGSHHLPPQVSAAPTLGPATGGPGTVSFSVAPSSWVSPRSSAALQSPTPGSQHRSWSQNSQSRRAAGLSSPRAPSALQSNFAGHSLTVRPAGPAGPAAGPYEVQMATLRTSLLQHIQSVQREITRLQVERHMVRQGAQSERQPSTLRRLESPIPKTATTAPQQHQHQLQQPAPAAQLRHLTQPQQPAHRPPGAAALSIPGDDRYTQVTDRRPRPQGPREGAAGAPSQLSTTPTSTAPTTCLGPATPVKLTTPPSAPSATPPPAPSAQPSLGAPVAAVIIQRAWRRHTARRQALQRVRQLRQVQQAEPQQQVVEDGRRRHHKGEAFVAIHHYAARIQRAWKVSRWRRRFVDFSARELGWVGTLDWLQHHNLLYGTELADPEDVSWWMQQRAHAPLDREVDPWGCTKLRDHLNKMWYGRTTEELEAEIQLLQQSQREQYQVAMEEAYASYSPTVPTYQKDVPVMYEVALTQPAMPAAPRGAELSMVQQQPQQPQQHYQPDVDARHAKPVVAITALRSPPSTERAERPVACRQASSVLLANPGALGAGGPAGKAASLSPRCETHTAGVRSDATARQNGTAAGAGVTAAASVMHATFLSPPQTHRVSRGGPVALPAALAAAVPAPVPAAAVPAATAAAAVGPGASCRPRSPIAHALPAKCQALPLQGQGASFRSRSPVQNQGVAHAVPAQALAGQGKPSQGQGRLSLPSAVSPVIFGSSVVSAVAPVGGTGCAAAAEVASVASATSAASVASVASVTSKARANSTQWPPRGATMSSPVGAYYPPVKAIASRSGG